MDRRCTTYEADTYLQKIIRRDLRYGLKSPDMDLYDFGFGDLTPVKRLNGRTVGFPSYAIHAVCEFEVIHRKKKCVKYYDANTVADIFQAEIQPLLGLSVQRIALSDKNDLWIDLGDYWIVFITFETDEESWRFFTSKREEPHLVASDRWLEFNY